MIGDAGNSTTQRIPLAARLMLQFFKGRGRNHMWKPEELVSELGCTEQTVRKNAKRLINAGLVSSQGRGRHTLYVLAGAGSVVPRKPPLSTVENKVLTFLKKKWPHSGRSRGIYEGTQATIGMKIRQSQSNVCLGIRGLEKKGLVIVTHRGHFNTYARPIASESTEVPLSPLQDDLLMYLKHKCPPRAMWASTLAAIAKDLSVNKGCLPRNIRELEKRHLIVVIRGPGSRNPSRYGRPDAAVQEKATSTRGRHAGDVNKNIAALLQKLGYPKRLSYHQVKDCFPAARVAVAKSDSAERRKIVKQANVVARRLLEKRASDLLPT